MPRAAPRAVEVARRVTASSAAASPRHVLGAGHAQRTATQDSVDKPTLTDYDALLQSPTPSNPFPFFYSHGESDQPASRRPFICD